LQLRLVLEGVLHCENAAPRVPQEIEIVPVESERLSHLLDLFDESREIPQRRVVWLVAVGGAELIVVVVLDAGGGEIASEALEVLVRGRGPAVQQQNFHAGTVADALRPDAKLAPWRPDGNHPNAAADGIGASAVIQVTHGWRVWCERRFA